MALNSGYYCRVYTAAIIDWNMLRNARIVYIYLLMLKTKDPNPKFSRANALKRGVITSLDPN